MSNYKTLDSSLYQLIKDAYYGSGGFIDSSYLIRGDKETDEKYILRKQLSSYSNYFAQVVDANIEDINNDVVREAGSELNERFSRDVDGNGTTAEKYWHATDTESELYGFVIQFLDSNPEQPKFESDMIEQRTYPKYIKITPEQIYQYRMEGEGNITYLSYKSGEVNGETVYTVYDKGYFYKGQMVKDEMTSVSEAIEAQTTLDVLTFLPYPDPWTLPPSRYGAVAKKALTIFNLESYVAFQSNQNTFSILVNPNQPLEDSVKFSENTVWNAVAKGGVFVMPAYLTYPNTMKDISEQVELNKKQIYEVTNLNVLSTSADASGESRAYSDVVRIQSLKRKAQLTQDFEMMQMMWFEELTGQGNAYKVTYPSDFASLTVSDQLDQYQKLLNMGYSEETQKQIKLSAYFLTFPNLSEDERNRVEVNEMSNILEPIEDDGELE